MSTSSLKIVTHALSYGTVKFFNLIKRQSFVQEWIGVLATRVQTAVLINAHAMIGQGTPNLFIHLLGRNAVDQDLESVFFLEY
jgi:hypothetical protein